MVKQMKYLGVLLDTKFSWKQHLSYISEKCDRLQRGLNRIARNTFGINLNVHSLIYKQGIEPFILYGSRVWEKNSINIIQFSDKSTDDFPVICYTDGSKIDGRVGFAFVVFRSCVESENFQFRIRDECTVFVAELLCLNFVVKWITEQNSVSSEYFMCTDSLSSLDSLKYISSSNNIIIEIQKQLKSLKDKNISIDFAFVRGHTAVLGNESRMACKG
ncbi:uncharacterized protein TNCV_69471 [Trichonephila clavipes]|nr:uncharacterized protein TNCV_69471 [Trichonephila clavipes]